jgi:competence ComEA-like helix-hairpin-helix protein
MRPLKGLNEFSVSEKRGLFALCLIIALLATYVMTYRFWVSSEVLDYSDYKDELIALRQADSVSQNQFKGKQTKQLFPFDPNKADEGVWKKLGFSEKQTKSILSYRDKSGGFRVKEDLLRLYVIDSAKYLQLEPYIELSNARKSNLGHKYTDRKYHNKPIDSEKRRKKKITPVSVNVNLASQDELKKIRGIGEVYAARIVKYRDLIGGFHSPEQLKEVYGIDDEKWGEIKGQITASGPIHLININSCKAYDIQKHPYIKNWDFPNAIISYREKNGEFKEVSDIYSIENLNQQQAKKLQPYLSVK